MKNKLSSLGKKLKSKTEIKYRGPLQESQVVGLIRFLSRHGRMLKHEYEKALYFESTAFPSIGDFKWGTARMSVKVEQKGTYLRLKEGNPAATTRQSYNVKVQKSQLANLMYILYRVGLTDGFYRPVLRRDYQYGKAMITIKTKCVMGDHFEIEPTKDSEDVKSEILRFLRKFNLHCWTEEEYKSRITRLMETAPAINSLQADMIE